MSNKSYVVEGNNSGSTLLLPEKIRVVDTDTNEKFYKSKEETFFAKKKEKKKFNPGLAELFTAIALVILSYLLTHNWWEYFQYQHKMLILGLGYVATVLLYARAKKITPTKESWYWLALFVINLLSFSLWKEHSLVGWQYLLFFTVGTYWTVTVFGGLLHNRTSNILLLDILNMTLIVPFKNLGALPQSLAYSKTAIQENTIGEEEKEKISKHFSSIIIGLLLVIPLLAVILPMLVKADGSGVFVRNLREMGRFIERLIPSFMADEMFDFCLNTLFAVPLMFIICGLVFGFSHKRETRKINVTKNREKVARMRILEDTTIITILVIIATMYTIFIFSQSSYYFAAFTGELPASSVYNEGITAYYSDYARDGFFELCRLVVLNLAILLCANLFSKKKRVDSIILKLLNVIIALITLLLILTAYSKMFLYIQVYGLTVLRVEVCIFLLFLMIVWTAIIVLQKKQFEIAQFALMVGTGMLTLLCISNIDQWIEWVNNMWF